MLRVRVPKKLVDKFVERVIVVGTDKFYAIFEIIRIEVLFNNSSHILKTKLRWFYLAGQLGIAKEILALENDQPQEIKLLGIRRT